MLRRQSRVRRGIENEKKKKKGAVINILQREKNVKANNARKKKN